MAQVLDNSITHGIFINQTMHEVDAICHGAMVEVKESYLANFGSEEIHALIHRELEQPNPYADNYARQRDWLTTLPLLLGPVVRRLNLACSQFVPSLYEKLSREAREKKKDGLDHLPWYLADRRLSFPFPTWYYVSDNAYDTRLIGSSPSKHSTWVSMHKDFRNEVAKELFSSRWGLEEYTLVSIDMSQCHARIVCQFINAPILSTLLESENMWETVSKPFLGLYARDDLKSFHKILYYKALNGGNIRRELTKHPPLVRMVKASAGPEFDSLSPSGKDEKISEIGLSIIDQTPVLQELETFVDHIGQAEVIYPVTSSYPFRYALKPKRSRQKGGISNMIPEYQTMKSDRVPVGVFPASPPQKISRFLTGHESILLTVMVRLIILHSVDALPLSLEYDGLQVLLKKVFFLRTDDLLTEVAQGLKQFPLNHLGCSMPITASGITFDKPKNIKTP
uniref:Uncharacterized protein n=1 Tax=Trebouxia lynnae TaxID=1825957 RepID=A0A6B9VQZ5_9CHLO|nr:hypothetical protein [Trebouxia lynnae]QHO63924.1 hypothetical protein [Trebouxia lynnae]